MAVKVVFEMSPNNEKVEPRKGTWIVKLVKLAKCEICNMEFGTSGELRNHKQIVHEGLKKHKCGFCEKRFSLPSHVKMHVSRMHEKTKDFICDHCNKAFATIDNLRKHISKIHESSRKLKCAFSFCPKMFSSKKL